MADRLRRLANLGLLQLAVVAPLLLARPQPIAAALVGWIACALQLVMSRGRTGELHLLIVGGLLGSGIEWGATATGLMAFQSDGIAGMPFWLFPSWAMLGVSFCYCLSFLRGRPVLATVVGAIGCGASLRLAETVGEIAVPDPTRFVAVAALLGMTIGVLSILAEPRSSIAPTDA
ncbi:MAG: DUF2878 family protein [Myxococcota bacterium]